MRRRDEEALSNKLFRKAMKKVGLKPPADEQETFWRIPVSLNPDRLRKAVEELDGKSIGENVEGNNAELSPVKGKNKARKETLAALAAARKKNGSASTRKRKERSARRTRGKEWRKTVNESTTESDVGNQSDEETSVMGSDVKTVTPPPSGNPNGLVSRKESAKRKKRLVKALDDSEDDDDEDQGISAPQQQGRINNNNHQADDNVSAPETDDANDRTNRGRSNIKEDDLEYSTNVSDSEEANKNTEKSKSETGKKRPRIESDDNDSDGDEEFDLPLIYQKKARRVLVDDDDDDDDDE